MNATSSKSSRTAPMATHHRAPSPSALAGVGCAEGLGAAEAGAVTDVEVVGVVGVAVAPPPGDPFAALKENVPLTGWPSAEVARQVTLYRPAGEPGCRRWAMVLSISTGFPVSTGPVGPVTMTTVPTASAGSLKVNVT
jgi:hypothetical protein